MNVVIREERPADVSAIDIVLQASFPTSAEARLVQLLRNEGALTLSLVAEVDGQIVGHVAFSPVATAHDRQGVGLAPVAVLDTSRRQGIAAKLIQSGLKRCRELSHGWCVVLGDPAYYARFGFRPASELGLHDDYGGGAAFQALELVPGTLPVDGGLVKYSPQFSMFE